MTLPVSVNYADTHYPEGEVHKCQEPKTITSPSALHCAGHHLPFSTFNPCDLRCTRQGQEMRWMLVCFRKHMHEIKKKKGNGDPEGNAKAWKSLWPCYFSKNRGKYTVMSLGEVNIFFIKYPYLIYIYIHIMCIYS